MHKSTLLAILFISIIVKLSAQPVITSFAPASGPVGTTVTITGSNFNTTAANNSVYFGAVKATVTAATSTTLTVTVPVGATYKPITVTTGGLTGYSAKPFTITFANSGHILPGSFATNVDVGSSIFNYTVADLDGDGRSDVIASRGASELAVYRNISSVGLIQFSGTVSSFTVRAGSGGIATGDLDMDGKIDVAIAGDGDGSSGVSIMRNLGSPGIISLGNRLDLITSIYSHCDDVAIYDFDGDGKSDVVVKNRDNTMSVYRNTNTTAGIFSFASVQNYTIGSGYGHLRIGDLDGDGKRDIVLTHGGSTTLIDIFRNTSTPGSISFAASSLTTPLGPKSAAIEDFDHDGKNDLVIAFDGSNMVSIYKSTSTTGTISFDPSPVNYTLNLYYKPRDVAVDDVDGDGLTDLVVSTDSYAAVAVYRHSDDANAIAFDAPVAYTGNGSAGVACIADMDRDGAPDLVIGAGFSVNVSVFRSTVQKVQLVSMNPVYGGAGTEVTIKGYNFTNTSAVQFGSTAVSSFTVVSDSVIKAVVANGPSGGTIKVTTPYGTTTGLGFTYSTRTAINYFSPLYGDTNTVVTIVGANFNTTPASNLVYFGDVKTNVLSATANSLTVKVPAGATYKPISVSNGQTVAYSAQPFTPVFAGSPAAFLPTSFENRKDYVTALGAGSVHTTDLDGDGKTDVILGNSLADNISVFRNISTTGVIALAPRVDYSSAIDGASDVVTADFDRDGKPDVAVAHYFGAKISVLKNTSTPGVISFAPKLDFTGPSYISRMEVDDVNRDGLPDIVASVLVSNGYVTIYLNTTYAVGDPISFTNAGSYSTGSNPKSMVLRDLNYDGNTDIIVSNSSDDNILIYKNNGGMSLTGLPLIATGDGPNDGLEVNDLNNDSLADIVNLNYNSSSLSVFQNISSAGNITYNTPVNYSTPLQPNTLALGPLAGDTKPDIAVSSGSNLSIFRNNSTAASCSMQPAVNYAAHVNAYNTIFSDLDNDGKPDVIVCNSHYTGSSISIYRNKINEAIVTPSGTSPVSGDIVSRVTIDPTVQTANGVPYVQRHYDIEPVTNPATSTATITLYFTQQEFDNYNAHPVHGTNLPGSPTDNANKANLRIFQYHGISATSTPNSYSGNGVEIDPDDNNIVWNATAQWWEVTFDITGFSGFFAGSTGNSILPLNLLSIKGHKQNNQAIVEWTTSDEQNVSHFTVQRSTNGRSFEAVGKVAARNSNQVTNYRYSDELGTSPVYYYRIQIVDKDNHSTNSKVVTIKTTDQEGSITIAPNPAKGRVSIVHPEATAGARLLLIDMSGKCLRTIVPATGSIETFISTTDLTSGVYKIVLQSQGKSYTNTLMVQ